MHIGYLPHGRGIYPNMFSIIENKKCGYSIHLIKNIKIDTDLNSAHISLEHTGEFELETPTPGGVTFLSYEWLESAFLIKENGKLKFKFYFSEQIND